jgi:TPR repeat protein
MHDTGEGVAVNPAEAVRWLRLSAAQDYPHAFTSLGVMYATGRGVPRDYAESRRNYERAARLGEAHGFYGLGVLHAEGQGVAADRMESLAYMMVAASMGDETANAAVRDANFQDAQMRAIIARANAIIADYGVDAPRIVLEGDEDEGQELVPVA